MDALLFDFLRVLLFDVTILVIGHPVFSRIRKKSESTRKLDLLEVLNYDFVIGSFLLLACTIIFALFNIEPEIAFLVLVSVSIIASLVGSRKWRLSKSVITQLRCVDPAVLLVASLMILSAVLSMNIISGSVSSTLDDGAWHTFLIRVTLRNPSSLITGSVEPYGMYYHTYPPIASAFGAILVSVFLVPIEKVIILLTASLPSLMVLAFYSCSRSMFENKTYAVVAAISAIFFAAGVDGGLSIWAPVGWSGIMLLFSFYFSLGSISLISTVISTQKNYASFLILGLAFAGVALVYPVALLLTFYWLLICIAPYLIRFLRSVWKSKMNNVSISAVSKRLVNIACFFVPMIIAIPYAIRLYKIFFLYPLNSYYPSDIPFAEVLDRPGREFFGMVSASIRFNWLIDLPKLSQLLGAKFGKLFALTPFSLMVVLCMLLILKLKDTTLSKKSKAALRRQVSSATDLYALLLLLLFHLTFLSSLSIGNISFSSAIDVLRVLQHILIPVVLLTSLVIGALVLTLHHSARRLIANIRPRVHVPQFSKFSRSEKIILSLALVACLGVSSIMFANLQDFNYSLDNARRATAKYGIVSNDDLMLMQWMNTHLAQKSIILVTAGDAGQYVTSVTQLQSIYEYSLRRFSRAYEDTLLLIMERPGSPLLIKQMLDYNVSYVFVGSSTVSYSLQEISRNHFDNSKLQYSPFFKPVKNFGASCLFSFDKDYAEIAIQIINSLDKAYYYDATYPSSWVTGLDQLFSLLQSNGFRELNADQLKSWMSEKIASNNASSSIVVLTMGVVPQTVAEEETSSALIRRYVDSGGTVVWLGDVPFFYQGIAGDLSRSTVWGLNGGLIILDIRTILPIVTPKAGAVKITEDGIALGMAVPDIAYRPVNSQDITLCLAEEENNMSTTWMKEFKHNQNTGMFLRYNAGIFNGSMTECNYDVLSLSLSAILLRNRTNV